jgi:hypothetical protein
MPLPRLSSPMLAGLQQFGSHWLRSATALALLDAISRPQVKLNRSHCIPKGVKAHITTVAIRVKVQSDLGDGQCGAP